MNYHTIIDSKYNNYVTNSTEMDYNAKKLYIMSIFNNDIDWELIFKFSFTVMGTYSSDKNIWVWSDQSHFLDTVMKAKISKMRKTLTNNTLSNNKTTQEIIQYFVKDNYSVIPFETFNKIITTILKAMDINIYIHHQHNKTNYLIIDRIIHDSIMN